MIILVLMFDVDTLLECDVVIVTLSCGTHRSCIRQAMNPCDDSALSGLCREMRDSITHSVELYYALPGAIAI